MKTRWCTAIAVVVLAATAVAGCQGRPPTSAPATPASSSPSESATPIPTPTPDATPSAAPSAPSTPSTPPASPQMLRKGATGPAVLALQERLVGLGYWLPAPDGSYGDLTVHAVTAFQKAAGLTRDGIAGPDTLAALATAQRLPARSASGSLIEVDLRRQLLLVIANGRVQWVMDTSTGAVAGTTPKGRHRIYRQIDGYHRAPLGVLYRPKYIYEGVAIHGYPSVPPYPASHGCVRLTNAAMDWLWSSGAAPIGTQVWVY